ncbi:Lrp/AsnC family transcriptional regulator [Massilibacteroides sp.]|uniref:Lrp/AsnC family transcriptional regulator n=1 Tax=Massilibacteroides sp. TaxID=2034766 RepID=UPI00263303B0|nr:Lrp/AsnC family transcriptional regulator [Massilibacteroides sp.]MDD4515737.1 Lrp/AsnC family transcriptional regulator [Massilibacteroides sp.]
MDNLDNIDISILKHLQENSNITTKELAQKVSLSSTPVFERVKQLERKGYIKKYMAILDEEKLNRGFIVFCFIKLKQHSKTYGQDFMKEINNIDEITECYNISGEFDFMIKVYVRDMKEYQDFVLNRLGLIDSIGSLQSTFVMAETKHNYGIPVLSRH